MLDVLACWNLQENKHVTTSHYLRRSCPNIPLWDPWGKFQQVFVFAYSFLHSLHTHHTFQKFIRPRSSHTDMKFVKKFTSSDFQAKNFTPSISPNFNSFSDKNTKKWVKMEKFTPLAKILHCHRHWRHWRHWQISTLQKHFSKYQSQNNCLDRP